VRARVERVHAAGPTVKVELVTEGGEAVQAELTQERHRHLALGPADEVWVRPRHSRSFETREDYSI
jgi:sulfate transport system ATP-binding protein